MGTGNDVPMTNGGEVKSEALDTGNMAVSEPLENPEDKDSTRESVSSAPSTPQTIDVSPNTQSGSVITRNISGKAISTTPADPKTELIEIDEKIESINNLKLDTFLYSLRTDGGKICNKIVEITNDAKIFKKGKKYEDIYKNPIKLFRETYESWSSPHFFGHMFNNFLRSPGKFLVAALARFAALLQKCKAKPFGRCATLHFFA